MAAWVAANRRNVGAGSLVGDPQFADPRQAAWPEGLRLRPGSAAIGRGRAVGLAADFGGRAVPAAAPPDGGVYQSAAQL